MQGGLRFPHGWEILVLQMNQMYPVTQAGLREIWAYVCRFCHSLFPPLLSLHRVLGCLISCWRFWGLGAYEHFQSRSRKQIPKAGLTLP